MINNPFLERERETHTPLLYCLGGMWVVQGGGRGGGGGGFWTRGGIKNRIDRRGGRSST